MKDKLDVVFALGTPIVTGVAFALFAYKGNPLHLGLGVFLALLSIYFLVSGAVKDARND